MAAGFKTGGRKAGTPNKVTTELRQRLYKILDDEIENLPELLLSLDTKERLDIICKLLPYVIPKAENQTTEEEKLPQVPGQLTIRIVE